MCGETLDGDVYRNHRYAYVTFCLRNMESKVDAWKEQQYDPLVEKVAEAALHVQAGVNAANHASFLFSCGLDRCEEVKDFAEKVMQQIRSSFTDKYCPISVPSVSLPNLNPLQTVLDWLDKIGAVFRGIDLVLGKLHCFSVPSVRFETRHSCHRVCVPCCSYHGRRRWWGGVRCSSCCHNVCVPYVATIVSMKRYCFSARGILEGIAGIIQKFLGPILSIIDKAIDFLLSPVRSLFGRILGMLNFNFPDMPTLPSFNFEFPTLPSVQCGAVQEFVS